MRPGTRTTLLLALVLLVLAGCGSGTSDRDQPKAGPTEPPLPRGTLVLDFEDAPESGDPLTAVENRGLRPIDVVARSNGTASLETVAGAGGGRAVRFPAYTGAAEAPAVVLVATAGLSDALDPTDRDFRFGATFELDERSSGSEADNGDNLVQRGNYDSPGQFKLQIDHGVPSCRVLGSDGEVFVEGDDTAGVELGRWYSVTCERAGSDVTLVLRPYGRPDETRTWKGSGATGRLDLHAEPLSIGGKVTQQGVPTTSADQFNGAVDNVFLEIGAATD